MSGKDYKVYLSDDGTAIGTMTMIEDQGDLTINIGKPLQTTNYKDGSKTAQGNEGWSASFSMGTREPLGTGQALVYGAMDAGGDAYMEVKSPTTGALQWSGFVKVTVSDVALPVSGEPAVTVQMAENGTITRGTTS